MHGRLGGRERERLEIECGQMRKIALRRLRRLSGQRVAAIRATTLAGLVFKAKYALAHNHSEPDPAVMTSIVDDLLAMSGEA